MSTFKNEKSQKKSLMCPLLKKKKLLKKQKCPLLKIQNKK